jgi:D-beta-D-heptose 7-phosphate kinase/D-beta-D-heptose 1-phosphate adenosyltransferase
VISALDLSRLQHLLDRGSAPRVLCLGDLMIDRYVHGEVGRISPEAPIPVLSRKLQTAMLGAAGNVARNVSALGARAVLIGVVGDDDEAHAVSALVSEAPGVEGRLVTAPGRRTTVKTRFVCGGQQLLRVDWEDDAPVSEPVEVELAAALEGACDLGAILISDYAKGVATPVVISAALAAARRLGCPVVVDPKGGFAKYGAVDLIKPNAKELSAATQLPTGTDVEVEAALAKALADCTAKALLVTRAGQGMTLMRRGGEARNFRARARTVFDVSGAGDTCLAALGFAYASGAALDEAIELAVLASGVVVGKAGAATATPSELVEAELAGRMAPAEAKVAMADQAAEAVRRWRAAGLRIGFTNGCFDILHYGHVASLNQARGWCDRLVVGLNSDASIKGLKGEGRPVNPLESRALVLAGLSCVDLVTPFDAATPIELIKALHPDVLIKSKDYSVEQVVGFDVVQAYGGEVRLTDLVDGYSTTAAIARMRS